MDAAPRCTQDARDLALFDFDGTITTRETFPDFIRHAIPPRRRTLGVALFAPLVVGYRLKLVPVHALRTALVRYAFRGVPMAAVEAAGASLAADLLPTLVRPEMQARIDWRAMGWAVEVSLRFTLDKTNPRAFDEFLHALRQVPEVIEIQSFLGSVDWRASVIARDMAHWQQVYRDRILTLPHLAELDALMLVATIKDSGELAL